MFILFLHVHFSNEALVLWEYVFLAKLTKILATFVKGFTSLRIYKGKAVEAFLKSVTYNFFVPFYHSCYRSLREMFYDNPCIYIVPFHLPSWCGSLCKTNTCTCIYAVTYRDIPQDTCHR